MKLAKRALIAGGIALALMLAPYQAATQRTTVASATKRAADVAPRLFEPGVVTIGEATTYRPTFSPDGNTVYFTLEVGSDYVILESHRRGGRWSRPAVVSFSGVHSDAEAFLSPNGKQLLFASRRPRSGDSAREDYDLWVADRTAAGRFGTPRCWGRRSIPTLGSFTRPSPATARCTFRDPMQQDRIFGALAYRKGSIRSRKSWPLR